MDISCFDDIAPIPTTTGTDQGCTGSVSGHSQDLPDFSLGQYSMHNNGGHGVKPQYIPKPPNEVESIITFDSLSSCANRKTRSRANSYFNNHFCKEPLSFPSDKSILPAAGGGDAYLAPGNMVWIKTVHHGWWPAEVMDIRVLDGIDSQHTARVLVQLFGFHERTWVDTEDLTQFTICYEERSKNPSEAFQDALKQALSKYGKRSLGISRDRCTGEIKIPTQHYKSPDASNTSISSSTNEDHSKEGGRGKRKRKLKIHFDEMTIPDNPARKLRRLKIMRLLGLAAPVGSPFPLTHRSS